MSWDRHIYAGDWFDGDDGFTVEQGAGQPDFPWDTISNLTPTNDREYMIRGTGKTFTVVSTASAVLLIGKFVNFVSPGGAQLRTRGAAGLRTSFNTVLQYSASGGNAPSVVCSLRDSGVAFSSNSNTLYFEGDYNVEVFCSIAGHDDKPFSAMDIHVDCPVSTGGGGPGARRVAVPHHWYLKGYVRARYTINAVMGGHYLGRDASMGGKTQPDTIGSDLTGNLSDQPPTGAQNGSAILTARAGISATWARKVLRPLRPRVVAEEFPTYDFPETVRNWGASSAAAQRAVGFKTGARFDTPNQFQLAEWDLSVSPPTVTFKLGTDALDVLPVDYVDAMAMSPDGSLLAIGLRPPQPTVTDSANGNLTLYKWNGTKYILQVGAVDVDLDFGALFLQFSPDGQTLWCTTYDHYYAKNLSWPCTLLWVYGVDAATPELTYQVAYELANFGAGTTKTPPRYAGFDSGGARFFVFWGYGYPVDTRAASWTYDAGASAYERDWTLQSEVASETYFWGMAPNLNLINPWSHDATSISNATAVFNLLTTKIASDGVLEITRSTIGKGTNQQNDTRAVYRVPGSNALIFANTRNELIEGIYWNEVTPLIQPAVTSELVEFTRRAWWPTVRVRSTNTELAIARLDDAGDYWLYMGGHVGFADRWAWAIVNMSAQLPFASLQAAGAVSATASVLKIARLLRVDSRSVGHVDAYPLGALVDDLSLRGREEREEAYGWDGLDARWGAGASGDRMGALATELATWSRARAADDAQIGVRVAGTMFSSATVRARISGDDYVEAEIAFNRGMPRLRSTTQAILPGELADGLASITAPVAGDTETPFANASPNGRFWLNTHTLSVDVMVLTVFDTLTERLHVLPRPVSSFVSVNGPEHARVADDGTVVAVYQSVGNTPPGRYQLYAYDGESYSLSDAFEWYHMWEHYGNIGLTPTRFFVWAQYAAEWPDMGETYAANVHNFYLLGTWTIANGVRVGGPATQSFPRTPNVDWPSPSYQGDGGASALDPTGTKVLFNRYQTWFLKWNGASWDRRPCPHVPIATARDAAWVEGGDEILRFVGTNESGWRAVHLVYDDVNNEMVLGPKHDVLYGPIPGIPAGSTFNNWNMGPVSPNGRYATIIANTQFINGFNYARRVWMIDTEADPIVVTHQDVAGSSAIPLYTAAATPHRSGYLLYDSAAVGKPDGGPWRILYFVQDDVTLTIRERTGGVTSVVDTALVDDVTDDAFLLLEVEGAVARAKVWPGNDAPPGTWQAEGAVVDQPGTFALGGGQSWLTIDHVAVGVGDYDAPLILAVVLGAAAIAASASLTIDGNYVRLGATALAAVAALAAEGSVITVGGESAADLHATGTTVAAGSVRLFGAVELAASASVAVVAITALPASATLTALGAVAAEALRMAIARGTLAAMGAVAATPSRAVVASAALAGVGATAAIGGAGSRAQLATSATFTAAGVRMPRAQAQLVTSSALAATSGEMVLAALASLATEARLTSRGSTFASWSPEAFVGHGAGGVAGMLLGVRELRGVALRRTGAQHLTLDHAMRVRIASEDGHGLIDRVAAARLGQLYQRGALFEVTTGVLNEDHVPEDFVGGFDPEVEPLFLAVDPAGTLYAMDLVLLLWRAE